VLERHTNEYKSRSRRDDDGGDGGGVRREAAASMKDEQDKANTITSNIALRNGSFRISNYSAKSGTLFSPPKS
jgi:hypothetical protein